MKINIAILLILFGGFSRKEYANLATENPNVKNSFGMTYAQSTQSFSDTYASLRANLVANEHIKIIAEVDHSANAASADLALPPTKTIFFGNPNLGTPLMQQNQLAGLDLPQKIVVYENGAQEVFIGFNNIPYLSARHGLEGVPTLPKIAGALTQLTTHASKGTLVTGNEQPHLGQGIITKTGKRSFEEAYASLRDAIANNPNLRIIAELDHQKNAAKVGLDLDPTRIIIFGNPKLGTPLMQNVRTTALDLPQKILVWKNKEGVVHVSYNDPHYLVSRHGITEQNKVLGIITKALDKLSNIAVGNP
ncbi:MAG: DUF302 domain-containing protein [Bacteroidota bacterium]